MKEMLAKLFDMGIVPVIKIDHAKDAIPLGKALMNGGLPVAEVTFRTSAAEESIRQMSNEFPDMLVGAGTVLTVEQAKTAVKAGAKFIVSPGFNPKVVGYCVENNIPITPGINNPTGIEQALEFGLKAVKFFPAEPSGGLNMLKAIAAPYGDMSFIPTGGITAANVVPYLKWNKIIACGGSWMVPPEAITAGRFDEIERLTKEAVCAMHGFEVLHIGINQKDETEAAATAGFFGNVFGFPKKEGELSYFMGPGIEVMKKPFHGSNGHIAIGVNSVERALAYLARLGIKPKAGSEMMDGSQIKVVYLEGETGGFALHLSRKA